MSQSDQGKFAHNKSLIDKVTDFFEDEVDVVHGSQLSSSFSTQNHSHKAILSPEHSLEVTLILIFYFNSCCLTYFNVASENRNNSFDYQYMDYLCGASPSCQSTRSNLSRHPSERSLSTLF